MSARTDQSQHFLIPAAANAEAERLGHTVVDTDHLLLGLLSAGGPDAATAARHGLRLTDLRESMTRLQREDLTPLLDTPVAPISAPHPPPRPAYTGESLPWSPRALTALREHGTHLLQHLATAPGPARRLLQHVGVDLSGADLAPTRSRGGTSGAGSAADGRRETTARAVVAVDAATLLAVASDETRLSSWFGDHTVRHTTLDEEGVLFDMVDAHGLDMTLSIRIRAEGSGSEVRLTLHDPADAADTSLVGRVLRWLRTSHLRAAITSLATAAA